MPKVNKPNNASAVKKKETNKKKATSNEVATGDFSLIQNGDDYIIPEIMINQEWTPPVQGTSDAVLKLTARGSNYVAFLTMCYKEAGYKQK